MYIAVVSVSLAKWEQTRSWTRVSIISRRRTLSGHGLFPRGVAVFYGVCSRSGRFLMLVSGRWEHRTVCSLASWRNHAPLVEAALFGHGKMPTMLEHGVCRDFIVWYLDAAYCSMNRAHLSLLFLLSLSLSLSLGFSAISRPPFTRQTFSTFHACVPNCGGIISSAMRAIISKVKRSIPFCFEGFSIYHLFIVNWLFNFFLSTLMLGHVIRFSRNGKCVRSGTFRFSF